VTEAGRWPVEIRLAAALLFLASKALKEEVGRGDNLVGSGGEIGDPDAEFGGRNRGKEFRHHDIVYAVDLEARVEANGNSLSGTNGTTTRV